MKRKWCKIVLAFACMASLFLGAVGAEAEVIHERELEDYILSQMSPAHVSGMSISIVSSEKELYCAAYGGAQKTTRDYILGDLSKSFTAAAIMRLAEDSELRLEDPVGDYLPEYQEISDVTIKDLLLHTSGISEYEVMSDIQAKGEKGTFEYANANYNLLGKIIEAVAGTSYMEYVSDNILDPLQMESTYSIGNRDSFSGELVRGYRNYFGFPFSYENKYDKEDDWMQIPSNYLISDVKDMGNYLRMYLEGGGKVLSKESVKAMLSQGVDIQENSSMEKEIVRGKARYMMGWIEKEINGEKMLYHTGRVENYTATMILLPEKDLGISLLFNTSDAVVGQDLIQQMEAGILAIEMDKKPDSVDGKSYFVKHGLIDFVMILALLGAWMPIFMMGLWTKKRRNSLWSPVGIGIDVLVHLVLPTVLLVVLLQCTPIMWIKRFVPSVYLAALAVIASLYIGAVIKVIVMIIYSVKGPKEEPENAAEEALGKQLEKTEKQSKETEKEKAEKPEKDNKPEEKKEEKSKE